jgi:signal transduction histidine kinase
MLREEAPDLTKGAEKVSRAVVQTHRMGRLTESLLAVSRIMAGKLVLDRERVDVGELVTDVVERMRTEAERSGCRLELSMQRNVSGTFDPLRIEQVVANLLTNAFRYARGAAVCVSVEGDSERVRIRVEDRGPGVPVERRARIFERFETGAQRSIAGLGLGLYISRQLIEAHGGTLELEPSEAGASFLATLPREPTVN